MSESEQTISSEEQALREAVASAQKAMVRAPCEESVKNFEIVNQALDRYLTKQMQSERRFKNALEVVDYLKAQSWKAGKSKVYADIKAAKLKAQDDGAFTLKEVDKYARAWLRYAAGKDKESDIYQRKLSAEADKQVAQAKWWELKSQIEEGLYVPKEKMERELAARAVFLRSDFENFFRSHVAELVTIAGGDQAKTPELLAFCLDAVADWLDRYAKQGGFTV